MKKTLLISFIFFHAINVLFAHDFILSSIKTNENYVTIYRGKSIQTLSNDNYLISMLAIKNEHGIQFLTSITNYSQNDYMFDENCISVYQGIYENNEWQQIKYVPASLYFEEEKEATKADEIWSAIALGTIAGSAGYSTVNGTNYVNGHRYTYTANVYSPSDAAIAMTNSYIALDVIQKNNQDYLHNLQNYLLFSSLILSNGNYNGFFIVNEEKGPDYKVVLKLSSSEEFIFYFTRSDKNEILNPWKDKSHARHSILAGISPLLNIFSMYYLWSRPKGIGFYSGISYHNDSIKKDIILETNLSSRISSYDLGYPDPLGYSYSSFYDWKADYDKSIINYESFGMFTGLTFKIFSNTWLLTGLGLELLEGHYYNAKLYYKYTGDFNNPATDYIFYKSGWIKDESSDLLISPQIGINFITNFLNFGIMATIPIKEKLNIDFIFGYAF